MTSMVARMEIISISLLPYVHFCTQWLFREFFEFLTPRELPIHPSRFLFPDTTQLLVAILSRRRLICSLVDYGGVVRVAS